MKLLFFFLFAIILSFKLVFQSTAQDNFPEIDGWKKSEPVQIYQPETLYQYINGAAELYLNYNFQELQVVEYQNEKNASIIVELYRHQTANDAFGIYSQERPAKGQFLNIGAQGYLEPPILNFVTHNFYVKISNYDIAENAEGTLTFYAEKLAFKLGGKSSLPIILHCFPESGKIHNSEKYIAHNFLGHGFLHSGFIADYVVDKEAFQLFFIVGADSSDCRKMLSHYFQLCQISLTKLKEGHHAIFDPYHGEIPFVWKGKFIWGILNLNDPGFRSKYLAEISEQISDQILEKHP